MSSEDTDIFIICGVNDIDPGCAKSFSLSRITAAGEHRPFPIVVVRTGRDQYVGYVNSCPHEGLWLNIGAGEFFTPDRKFLRCGRHGSRFEIGTGACVDGPCLGKSLQPITLRVVGRHVCICGIPLVEDDGLSDSYSDPDETMEIMIHPD